MFKKEVTAGLFTAVYALIVLEHILNGIASVHATSTILSAVLATVVTNNLHSEAAGNDLAFVTIAEFRTGFVIDFPPLRPSGW